MTKVNWSDSEDYWILKNLIRQQKKMDEIQLGFMREWGNPNAIFILEYSLEKPLPKKVHKDSAYFKVTRFRIVAVWDCTVNVSQHLMLP